MRNTLIHRNLNERARVRIGVAIGLVASLAVFGCTTNRTHGEGEPYLGAPSVGPAAPTSHTNATSVPTTPAPLPQPMTSSYQGNEQVLASPRPQRLTPDEAALIMADHLPKVRVLGVVNPGPAVRPYASVGVVTGQVHTAVLNPQVTINSSLSSPGVPAITSGAGGDVASSGAAVFTTDAANATPTTAAIAVTPGMLAGGTNTTIASSGVPVVTAASTVGTAGTTTTGASTTGTTIGAIGTVGTTIGTTAATTPSVTAASTVTPTTTATGTVRGLNTTSATNGSVSISTVNGKVTVSNVKSQ